ncbi:MAG: hypothetical protein P8X90_33945, partial [Desulfobacterales bacterium]
SLPSEKYRKAIRKYDFRLTAHGERFTVNVKTDLFFLNISFELSAGTESALTRTPLLLFTLGAMLFPRNSINPIAPHPASGIPASQLPSLPAFDL